MGVSSWETIVTPLAQQHFDWGVDDNSLLFILSGAVLFFSNIVLVRIATAIRLSDELGTLVSIIVATAGAAILHVLLGGSPLLLSDFHAASIFILSHLCFGE